MSVHRLRLTYQAQHNGREQTSAAAFHRCLQSPHAYEMQEEDCI